MSGQQAMAGDAMLRALFIVLFAAFSSAAQIPPPGPIQPSSQVSPPAQSNAVPAVIIVPAGTKIPLAMLTPLPIKSSKPGDVVYAETIFPTTVDDSVVIPPRTRLQGQIDSMARGGFLGTRMAFQIHFTQMAFPNDYVVDLSAGSSPSGDIVPALASFNSQSQGLTDLYLDRGAEITMVLQVSVSLDAAPISSLVANVKPVRLDRIPSASQCRPSPGSPATPPTVIPGTPPTPPTVIPGVNGSPDIVIPGSSGTPDTTIPGTPGTPPQPCILPAVTAQKDGSHKESIQLTASVKLPRVQLPAGKYQVSWKGNGPFEPTNVTFVLNHKTVAIAEATVVTLAAPSAANAPATHANADGSVSLDLLRFKKRSFALYFAQQTA
jgi:hypothetical protein